jgi:hypothetical protein
MLTAFHTLGKEELYGSIRRKETKKYKKKDGKEKR